MTQSLRADCCLFSQAQPPPLQPQQSHRASEGDKEIKMENCTEAMMENCTEAMMENCTEAMMENCTEAMMEMDIKCKF